MVCLFLHGEADNQDIDYMYQRWIQTLDPDRFALDKVRYVINQLQQNGQDFIVMVSIPLHGLY